jgi:hypothetical protein
MGFFQKPFHIVRRYQVWIRIELTSTNLYFSLPIDRSSNLQCRYCIVANRSLYIISVLCVILYVKGIGVLSFPIGNEKYKLVDVNYILIQTWYHLTMWKGFWKNHMLWLITRFVTKGKTTGVTWWNYIPSRRTWVHLRYLVVNLFSV